MDKNEEMVLCVPTDRLFDGVRPFSGFLTAENTRQTILKNIQENYCFVKRKDCETNPEWKQIIPYCLITAGKQMFATKRKTGGAEERLHNKHSLGIGGHINPGAFQNLPDDDSKGFWDFIYQNLMREISEEVYIKQAIGHLPRFIGAINDDSNPVGTVHFGLVFQLPLNPDCEVAVKETDQLEGRFIPLKTLDEISNWEPWSKICIENCFKALHPPGPKVIIVNGRARSGKDSFCNFLQDNHYDVTFNLSTVSTVKMAAKVFGADEKIQKTDAERKLWSDLKDAWTAYNDGPFNETVKKIALLAEKYGDDSLFLVHVREPAEIEKFKNKYGNRCQTVLINRDGIHTPNNHADEEVEDYAYDFIIENNGTFEDLEHSAIQFLAA